MHAGNDDGDEDADGEHQRHGHEALSCVEAAVLGCCGWGESGVVMCGLLSEGRDVTRCVAAGMGGLLFTRRRIQESSLFSRLQAHNNCYCLRAFCISRLSLCVSSHSSSFVFLPKCRCSTHPLPLLTLFVLCFLCFPGLLVTFSILIFILFCRLSMVTVTRHVSSRNVRLQHCAILKTDFYPFL